MQKLDSTQPIPFINPIIEPGESRSKALLHNYYGLGRTNILKHALYPSKESVELRLKGVLANIYSGTFSSPETAKLSLLSKLSDIHPAIPEQLESEIARAETVEKVRDLARTFFSRSWRIAPDWSTNILQDLGSPVSHTSETAAEIESPISFGAKSALRRFWRSIVSSELPFNERKNFATEELGKLGLPPSLLRKYEDIQESTDIESLEANLKEHADNLDEEIKPKKIPTRREQITARLRETWISVIDQRFTTPAKLLVYVASQLQDTLPSIEKLYQNDLRIALVDHDKTGPEIIQSMKNRAERYLYDLDSIKFAPNLHAVSVGDTGSPKLIDWIHSQIKSTGFMKNLESTEEIDQNRLYSWIFPSSSTLPLRVPKASALDHSSTPSYTYPNGAKTRLSEGVAAYIKDLTVFMTTANTPRDFSLNEEVEYQSSIRERPIGLFERVMGENLQTFFSTQYKDLNDDQKMELFTRLGMAVLLDLILGNQDRLLLLNMDNPNINEQPLPANLGNIMISPDGSMMHLIDNGINNGQMSQNEFTQEEINDKYLKFLREVLNSARSKDVVARKVVLSILSAFEGLDEDGDNPLERNLQESLSSDPEIESTKLIPLLGIKAGMEIMEEHLRTRTFPLWVSPSSSDFQSTFSPEFVDMITNRLHTLNQVKAPLSLNH